MTCYRCGKVGHIATDPKCPEYKKPAQRQMFAAQVIDDRSEDDQPEQTESPDISEEREETPGPDANAEDLGEERTEQPEQEDCPDGSQFDDEPPYEEYDGYALPSDSEEPEYIRAMHEDESGARPAPPQFEDAEWQV